MYFEFTTCDCTNGVSNECQFLENTNCLANVLKSSKFVENRWKSRKSIIRDFNKISYLWHQTTKKCEGFAEFCLKNIWDTCKHHTMVLSLFTTVFGFHMKKSSFRDKIIIEFREFRENRWKSMKIDDRKFRNHDLSRKVIVVDIVHDSCQPAISLKVCAFHNTSGNIPVFWSDSRSGFGSPLPEGQLWQHYL